MNKCGKRLCQLNSPEIVRNPLGDRLDFSLSLSTFAVTWAELLCVPPCGDSAVN